MSSKEHRGTAERASQKRRLTRGLIPALARATSIRRAVPAPLRRLGGRLVPWEAYQRSVGAVVRPERERGDVPLAEPRTNVTLGIVEDLSNFHVHFVHACQDLGVPYRLLDISGPDWLEAVMKSGCDAFLVRPTCLVRLWKERCDERLRVMVEELGLKLCPSLEEIWLYESKRRTLYWLQANGVPHARTWVFYSEDEAMEFAEGAELPIVFKTDFGSGAAGVKVIRSRREMTRLVRRCFGRGIRLPDAHPLERQWGNVLLQEFLPDVREWRCVRVGNSFFALEKLKRGDYHSGSGAWRFVDPPLDLMDFVKDLTDLGRFRSMSVDVFETPEGRYLVNEMHTVFASPNPYKMKVGGRTGRYLFDEGAGIWRFEEGTFCENACCNLRVEGLLEDLERRVA